LTQGRQTKFFGFKSGIRIQAALARSDHLYRILRGFSRLHLARGLQVQLLFAWLL
jgi:hypothetical protein